MPTLSELIKQPGAPAALALFGRAGIAPDVGGGMLDYDSAQAQLAQALKFDPNAYLERAGGDDGSPIIGADQGPGYTQFVLHMDNSKLPQFAGKGDASKYGGWAPVDLTGQNQAELAKNPDYVINDPNYGAYTYRGNLKANPNDQMDSLWKGIDLAAHTIGGLATGGVAGLVTSLPGALGAATSGGGFGGLAGLAPSLIGMIPGMEGLAPYINLARQAYGASQGNLGQGAGAGMTLARLFNSGGGG
jgi:hypothetical protein